MRFIGSGKAQAAMEYMLIMAIAMLILVPLFSVVSSYTSQSKMDLRINALEDSIKNLADTADMVYSQGYPARMTTEFFVPKGIVYTNITEHRISARIQTSAGPADISTSTTANLTGSLPQSPGNYPMKVQMTVSGVVNITY